MSARVPVMVGALIVIMMLASCKVSEVNISQLASEIDAFPEMNSFPEPMGVVYIGSDHDWHYFRVVKPFEPDRGLRMAREELSLPEVLPLTDDLKDGRWLYGSKSNEPFEGYVVLFSQEKKYYFIQSEWKGLLLQEPPYAGMKIESGQEPEGIAFQFYLSSQAYGAYIARYKGIDYLLARGHLPPDNRSVQFIQTFDPDFRTPEGIKVGDSLEDVKRANGSEETEIVFMGQCAVLRQSQWIACFGMDDFHVTEGPKPDGKVEYFIGG